MADLSNEERRQAAVFESYLKGRVSQKAAQRQLKLPRSTFWRRLARFRKKGRAGLVHGLRGRPNRRLAAVRAEVLKQFRKKPSSFVTEFYARLPKPLAKRAAYSTVRQWLRRANLLKRPPRKTRRSRGRR
ncbi:MAG: helix-turn-helix domain-containing protein [Myxococcaceae bacterium]